MNKSKIVLASIGGFCAVLILAAGWFVWNAWSKCNLAEEGDPEAETPTEGLQSVRDSLSSAQQARPYPCAESKKKLKGNLERIRSWQVAASNLASRGDCTYPALSDATFKTFLTHDAKRLRELPGGVAGRLTKPDFGFGSFKEYISEGKMPQNAEIPSLQRQWGDLSKIATILSEAGVIELQGVTCKTSLPKQEAAGTPPPRRGNARRPRGKNVPEAEKPKQDCQQYEIVFTTRGAGFVRALAGLTTADRFMIVDNFAFNREKDPIALALTGAKKDGEEQQTGRRTRAQRREADSSDEKSAAMMEPGSVITDPLLDEPLKVTLTVSVYDFGVRAEVKK